MNHAGKQRIWEKRGDIALEDNDLETALEDYRKAGLGDKVAEIEQEIDRRDLAAEVQKFETLEQEGLYQDALALVHELAAKYPEEREWATDLERLERKTHLADLYRRALKAWQSGDRQTAQGLLVEVIALEPGYEKATRYLHLAVTGIDAAELQTQLEKERSEHRKFEQQVEEDTLSLLDQLEQEKKDHQEAQTKAKKESKVRRELGQKLEQLQNQFEQEKKDHQEAQTRAKKESKARRELEQKLGQLQNQFEQEKKARQQTERNARKKAEMRRTPAGLVIATPENLAQLLALLEPPARVWWEQAEIELCLVEAGEFLMGSPEGQGRDDEHPQHAVRLDAYYMGRYPVTQAQYARFVRETGHRAPFVKTDLAKPYNWDQKRKTPPKGREEHPVVLISWKDAAAYCKWAGLRLPTEAEWEKAASWVGATTEGRPQGQKQIYPWGDEWNAERCNTREGGKSETTPVGAYSPPGDSPSGCADMAGNVWEWCSSLYKPYPYDPDDGRENMETSGSRVTRGGSWYHDRFGACSARRSWDLPDYLDPRGFRCCVSPTSF